MLGPIKLLVAGGAFVALPFVAASAELGPQDPNSQSAQASKQTASASGRWNFSRLQYTPTGGKIVEVAARDISKLGVRTTSNGGIVLEILYKNTDYSLIKVESFHLIRRSGIESAVDVAVSRATLDGIAFPKL